MLIGGPACKKKSFKTMRASRIELAVYFPIDKEKIRCENARELFKFA